jgi:hypothetical protein
LTVEEDALLPHVIVTPFPCLWPRTKSNTGFGLVKTVLSETWFVAGSVAAAVISPTASAAQMRIFVFIKVEIYELKLLGQVLINKVRLQRLFTGTIVKNDMHVISTTNEVHLLFNTLIPYGESLSRPASQLLRKKKGTASLPVDYPKGVIVNQSNNKPLVYRIRRACSKKFWSFVRPILQ